MKWEEKNFKNALLAAIDDDSLLCLFGLVMLMIESTIYSLSLSLSYSLYGN